MPLSVAAMEALLAGDLEAAATAAGVPLTPYLVDHGWLWRLRLDQVADNAASLAILRRAGFALVGEQYDEVDGLELVLERPL